MSFICGSCGTLQGNRMKPNRVISEKRERVYPIRREDPNDPKSKIIDNGGHGWEIVSEKNICNECYGYKG